jgi:hypothetical protein
VVKLEPAETYSESTAKNRTIGINCLYEFCQFMGKRKP